MGRPIADSARRTPLGVFGQQPQRTWDDWSDVGVGARHAIGRIAGVRNPKGRGLESVESAWVQRRVPRLDIVDKNQIRASDSGRDKSLNACDPYVIERQPVDAIGELGSHHLRCEPQPFGS